MHPRQHRYLQQILSPYVGRIVSSIVIGYHSIEVEVNISVIGSESYTLAHIGSDENLQNRIDRISSTHERGERLYGHVQSAGR